MSENIHDEYKNKDAKKAKKDDMNKHKIHMKLYNDWINYDLQTAIMAMLGFLI